MSAAVIVTTTPTIEGKKITSYRGIVTGEAIMGANIFKDLFAGIRDIVGGRSATYERELRGRATSRWRRSRPPRPRWAPTRWSAIDIDYETVGTNASMLMVTVSGTAVVVSLSTVDRPSGAGKYPRVNADRNDRPRPDGREHGRAGSCVADTRWSPTIAALSRSRRWRTMAPPPRDSLEELVETVPARRESSA